MNWWNRIREALSSLLSTAADDQRETDALATPIERVLAPLGFVETRREVLSDIFLVVEWATDAVIVYVNIEPREYSGEAAIGRRLPREEWGKEADGHGGTVPWSGDRQPYWSFVFTDQILRARGREPRVTAWRDRIERGPAAIARWAEEVSLDLADLEDLLRGEHLEELDAIIEAQPRTGVPGIDFKV